MIEKKDDNFLSECSQQSCKKLNIGKKKKFTIVEGIKLFQIMSSNNTQNLNKTSFWQKIQDQNLIPERTADQMKRFWSEYENFTVEQWLAKAIHTNLDFCFSVKQIPSPDFTQNFRIKYDVEFIRLDTMEPNQNSHISSYLDRANKIPALYNQNSSVSVSSVYSVNYGQSINSAASQSEG